jgi:hypothetical protein
MVHFDGFAEEIGGRFVMGHGSGSKGKSLGSSDSKGGAELNR